MAVFGCSPDRDQDHDTPSQSPCASSKIGEDQAKASHDQHSHASSTGAAHGHHHDHHSHHGGHVHAPRHYGKAFFIGITLNTLFVIAEALWGAATHSLSLLSDAGHNLSDVFGLGAAWMAHAFAKRAPTGRFTYGFRRMTILVALVNSIVLLLVTGGIVWEAASRLAHPDDVSGKIVMVVAFIGVLVNGGTALLFMRGSKDDLNLRGAYLHLAADALIALAVVLTGFLIILTGWRLLDPLMSLIVCALIVVGTWSLLRGSLDMALDGAPKEIDLKAVDKALRAIRGVTSVHHLHVWALSTTETALTVHLVSPASRAEQNTLLREATEMLSTTFKITHATLQIEASAPNISTSEQPC